MKLYIYLIVLTSVMYSCEKQEESETSSFLTFSTVGPGMEIAPDLSFDELLNSDIQHIQNEGVTFFIGYRQVSDNNQNPVLIRFDNGELTWKRTDLETNTDDCRGYGLIWDGDQRLYAVFSSTGTQGAASEDFRRFATNGWLSSYGQGGGPKVSVMAKIDPETGTPETATFITALLSNGNSNSVEVTRLMLSENNNVMVTADSWYAPRDTEGNAMICEGESPFVWNITFTDDLSTAVESEAEGCSCGS